jgi:DNA-binding CsgD family transcriptional regulator
MKEGKKKLSLSHPSARSVSSRVSRATSLRKAPHVQTREPLRYKNWQVGERVKELTSLCAVSQLKDDPNQTLHDFLNRVVRLIPPGWQYPESTCVRISFRGREFVSENYCESNFRQAADLIVDGEQVGTVEVAYREEKPKCDEGPFLKEERTLLDALAREISTFIRSKQDDLKLQLADSKLREEQQHLEDKNTTLREVLKQIEDEKRHIITQVQTNVDRVVAPILRMLSNKVSPSEQHYLTLLSNSLKDITSPFLSNLENRSRMLSPREGEICNMIRNGLSSKDIAAALDVSLHTVLKQRQRIRKKLGISNDQINLASFLQTI